MTPLERVIQQRCGKYHELTILDLNKTADHFIIRTVQNELYLDEIEC